jgi:hypothetical protein
MLLRPRIVKYRNGCVLALFLTAAPPSPCPQLALAMWGEVGPEHHLEYLNYLSMRDSCLYLVPLQLDSGPQILAWAKIATHYLDQIAFLYKTPEDNFKAEVISVE